MSDTTPKDQPPKPLQFPEPVEVRARTKARRKTAKAADNVFAMQSPEHRPFMHCSNEEIVKMFNTLTGMKKQIIEEINERLSRCTCSKKP